MVIRLEDMECRRLLIENEEGDVEVIEGVSKLKTNCKRYGK